MRTEWNQNVQFAGTLFVANLLHSFGRDPLHLHRVKLVAKLQQRKETETSQYSLDHWHWDSPAPSWAASFQHRTLLSSLRCIQAFFVCSMKTLIFTYLTAIIFRCSFLSECLGMINKIIHVQTKTENHIHLETCASSSIVNPDSGCVFVKLTAIRITVVHKFFIMLSSAQLTNFCTTFWFSLQASFAKSSKTLLNFFLNFVHLETFFSQGSKTFLSCCSLLGII